MKLIRNISIMLLAAAAIVGCEKYDKAQVERSAIKAPILSEYPTGVVTLKKERKDSSDILLKWNPAQYGYAAAVTYTVEAYVDGKEPVEIGQTYLDSIYIINKVLNTALTKKLGASVEEPIAAFSFKVRLVASIGPATYDTISLPVTLKVVPWDMAPTPLWVIGEYSGWNHANSTLIYSENSDNVYKGWVYMNVDGKPVGEMDDYKFTPAASWNDSWGGALDALVPNGGNMKIANGYCYLFNVDLNPTVMKGSANTKFLRLGMIGEATPNGWDTPDTELKWDAAAKVFKATGVQMKAGGFKFRADNDWALNWGVGPRQGQLSLSGGGDNITFTGAPGTYTVIVDLCQLFPTYQFIAE